MALLWPRARLLLFLTGLLALSALFAGAARALEQLPVVVVPGADHFFHRKLHLIKSIIKGQWR